MGMKPGDIFLVSEPDRVSRVIQWATHGDFNHAGIVTGDDGAMVEALSAGVAAGNLAKYAGVRCAVVDTGLTDAERAVAVAFALGCVGDAYDWLDIASFGINLLTDGALILGQAHKFICSALVYRSLQWANPARFPADCHTISPNDLARMFGAK
jgi:uncharacterized protein YycO